MRLMCALLWETSYALNVRSFVGGTPPMRLSCALCGRDTSNALPCALLWEGDLQCASVRSFVGDLQCASTRLLWETSYELLRACRGYVCTYVLLSVFLSGHELYTNYRLSVYLSVGRDFVQKKINGN